MKIPTYDPTDAANYPGDGPLRVAGQSVSDVPQDKPNLPSTLSTSAAAQRSALGICRDLFAGNERVHDKAQLYLPKAPGEDPGNYGIRLTRSVFFNVFRHTIDGLAGFVFRKDPVLGDDVPAPIREAWENIDLAGTHGDVFARDLLVDGMCAGHAAILVDFPDTGGTQSHAAEQVIRPYWVPIKKDNILSWRTTVENGRIILTQLVLQETTCVSDGAFGDAEQTQYRVLYRTISPLGVIVVGWRLLQITKDKKVITVGKGWYGNQVEIPVAEIPTSGRIALFESTPPLLDLAFLNIAHYQGWSDYATSIHMTCVPILFLAGMQTEDGAEVVVGPNSVLTSSDPTAKAEYVSHSGQALTACKGSLDDLKGDMASLGVAMLATQKRVAETAEAKRIGKADTDSSLGVTARGLQDGLERALDFHARYLKLDDGGSIKINRDFEDMSMPADLMIAWATLAEKMSIPVMVVLQALQEGGRIAPDVNLEELEQQIAAAAAAAADQAAQQAKDLIAMKQQQPPQKGLPQPAVA